ncbi:MAG: family 20 glycosylhydrolase [Alistipes sp.]|nr:family 20 glycosylhydrolase [Alistipes sp.]
MKLRLLALITLLFAFCAVTAQEPTIIPTPRQYCSNGGEFTLNKDCRIGWTNDKLEPIAHYLADYLQIEAEADGTDIVLGHLWEGADEEYSVEIGEHNIYISGCDYGGVFNGVVTLLQLLPEEVYSHSLQLPATIECCTINDSPRYPHRGFMLDPCRTWIAKEAIMDYIDLLALHKINNLRLHLTDDEAWRLEIKSHPELAEVGGFRGGDSPIWPRYGKWNERWGGYYTQDDMREIIAYAAVRNIEVIPEIDLPGHSLCMATMHPEILCNYEPNKSRAFGYDTRSAFCPTKEANYELLEDILKEVCELFPTSYIHIGGDEVDMSQWRRCPDCQAFMRKNGMANESELQRYFMSRLTEILAKYGKQPAVWNEAIEGGKLADDTRVYGWEGIKECRTSAREGYSTVVMPGQYFYFDMKQTPREPGHDWAAIFDYTKVYNFTLAGVGFTDEESKNVLGFEASFFSEAYASRNPESARYLHYMTFPRLLALAEICWVDSDERDVDAFYTKMVRHYDKLDRMGVAYRLMPPKVEYVNGMLSASTDDFSDIYYRREPMTTEMLYTEPIATDRPAEYSFVARRGEAMSPEVGVAAHFKTITPPFTITSSMGDRENFSFEKAQGYGRLARTSRAADVGDWVEFTFDTPVRCRRMKVATGNFQLPRFIFENGYVELSYDGRTYERVGELECGMFIIEYPSRPIKSVRITCTSQGNGAEWVSVQPPTIWPML